MNIKLFFIFGFSILYAFFEILMSLRYRNNRSIKKSGDRLSIWILYISITFGYWFSFIIGSTKIGRIYPWNTFFTIGFVLIFIGLIIRISSIFTLKKQFTYKVTTIENHQLIEIGLYKNIRHPGYLGQLIIFTGVATSVSNWISVILMLVPILAGYVYRITVEEKFMVNEIGQSYIEYKKRTNRLIPMIY
jgi:protein-S-isoprenylcysteine O-methyltransferase